MLDLIFGFSTSIFSNHYFYSHHLKINDCKFYDLNKSTNSVEQCCINFNLMDKGFYYFIESIDVKKFCRYEFTDWEDCILFFFRSNCWFLLNLSSFFYYIIECFELSIYRKFPKNKMIFIVNKSSICFKTVLKNQTSCHTTRQ